MDGMAFAKQAKEIIESDLEPDLAEALMIAVGWSYPDLFQQQSNAALPKELLLEEFNRGRGPAVTRAMAETARRFGVPIESLRLDCNGQTKLLFKVGRVILIQEPIREFGAAPAAADYKRKLAALHSDLRQLELDLGDRPPRNSNWSGYVLAVLLHGPRGAGFSREDCALGEVMLGVPDAAYEGWTLRLDLHDLAMFGRQSSAPAIPAPEMPATTQPDLVVVRRRKPAAKKDSA
jgi:hypothetical protein